MTKNKPIFFKITLIILCWAVAITTSSGQKEKVEFKALSEQVTQNNSPKSYQLDLKIILDGGFSFSQVLPMRTILLNSGHIPTYQPFNPNLPYYNNSNPVWLYAGSESVASIPANVVDWILVELRDASDAASATSSTTTKKMAVFLLSSGSVVDLDGVSMPTFDVSISQNLFVVIYHRNHLSVMSSVALIENGGIYSYDFTTDPAQVYRGDFGCVEISTGLWGSVGGDGNADNQVDNPDKIDLWGSEAGSSGYFGSDYCIDGEINGMDLNFIWRNDAGRTSQVP